MRSLLALSFKMKFTSISKNFALGVQRSNFELDEPTEISQIEQIM